MLKEHPNLFNNLERFIFYFKFLFPNGQTYNA